MIAGEKRHSALYPELKYAHQKVPPSQHCAAAEILLCARKNYHRDAPSSWQTEPSSPPVCALLPQPCGGVLQGTFPSHLCTCTGPCMIERSVPETECPVAIDRCLDSEHGRPTGTSEAETELNWRPAMEQVRFIHCASLARRRSRTTTLRLPQLCDFSLYHIRRALLQTYAINKSFCTLFVSTSALGCGRTRCATVCTYAAARRGAGLRILGGYIITSQPSNSR
jgi:hypothetical protein